MQTTSHVSHPRAHQARKASIVRGFLTLFILTASVAGAFGLSSLSEEGNAGGVNKQFDMADGRESRTDDTTL